MGHIVRKQTFRHVRRATTPIRLLISERCHVPHVQRAALVTMWSKCKSPFESTMVWFVKKVKKYKICILKKNI